MLAPRVAAPLMPWLLVPPNKASSWGMRVQVVPSAEAQMAASGSSPASAPTAMKPGPPVVRYAMRCSPGPPRLAGSRGRRDQTSSGAGSVVVVAAVVGTVDEPPAAVVVVTAPSPPPQ